MPIERITVIGAGIMGRGIAHAAAVAGYQTVLEDLLPASLRRAENEIQDILDAGVERGKLGAEARQAALGRLRFATGIDEAVRAADLVIEAVPEELETKIEILITLDKMAPPACLFASNTSALSITELAAVTYRPGQCIGMHFFNPVHKMRLLEIIRGLETTPATIDAAVAVARRMNKEPVVIRESPAFITSRMNALTGNQPSRGNLNGP